MKNTGTGCLFALLTEPFNAAIKGWAIAQLWLWFAVPLGVPAIGIAHAFGIALLMTLLAKQYHPEASRGETDMLKLAVQGLVNTVLISVMAVALGWVTKGFIV